MGEPETVETKDGAGEFPRPVKAFLWVMNQATTVAWLARRDLTDQRARRVVTGACAAALGVQVLVGVVANRRRSPAPENPATVGMTREERVAYYTEHGPDPEAVAALKRAAITGVSIVGGRVLLRQALPPVLRRRGVRRPYLVTGLALAGYSAATTLVARRLIKPLRSAGPAAAPEAGRT